MCNNTKNENPPCFAVFSNSPVLQEGRTEGSRWSKYLDQESEDQEDDKEEAALEGQQFCSQRKNTVGEQRYRENILKIQFCNSCPPKW